MGLSGKNRRKPGRIIVCQAVKIRTRGCQADFFDQMVKNGILTEIKRAKSDKNRYLNLFSHQGEDLRQN